MGYSQQSKVEIQGTIVDTQNVPIPYASIGIPSKYVGTSSTSEGTFYFLLTENELADTIEISSIGYGTFKIKVQDFINLKEKMIILEDNITDLDAVLILNPKDYVNNAIDNLKDNTVSDNHQLNVLYRRSSLENGKAKLFVEHYLHLLERGPSTSSMKKIQVVEGRKSGDYREYPENQRRHAIYYMARRNPIRRNTSDLRKREWKKSGNTTFDNEDVLILEDFKNKDNFIKLYVGIDSYKIYKIETDRSLYIYKKNSDGKLYLSYNRRIYESVKDVSEGVIAKRKRIGLPVNYKMKRNNLHEIFVLGIETDKKKINVKSYGEVGKDIANLKVKYNPEFWSNFNSPPDTEYYIKTKTDLEAIYGVPLETQFKYSSGK
jgi:hypothetical protein